MFLACVAVAAVACSAPSYSGVMTNRFYPDITAWSPNRAFRLEAKSPDNTGARPQPFASNFTYTLYDGASDVVLWQRTQPMKPDSQGRLSPYEESSPVRAFLNDAGNAVIVTGTNNLFALSPRDGARTAQVEILDQFSESEHEQFVTRTTGGYRWSSACRWSFLNHPDVKSDTTTYFVVRPYWEHRIVMDVSTGTTIDLGGAGFGDTSRAPTHWHEGLIEAILADEALWAYERIRTAAQNSPAEDDHAAFWELQTAVTLAGRRRVRDAIPFLRQLEGIEHGTVIAPGAYSQKGLRGEIHLALRRLGEIPSSKPAVSLFENGPDGTAKQIPWSGSIRERSDHVARVHDGMTVRQLVAATGPPDYTAPGPYPGNTYDYDIDTKDPYTLRVLIGEGAVQRITRLDPVWLDGFERERQMFGLQD